MNTAEESTPAGLYQRYNVTKKNGEPTDPRATYFVLRLDKAGRDPVHTKACRAAAHVYAAFVQSSSCGSSHLAQVGRELADLLNELDPPDPSADKVGGALIVGIDPLRREVVINLDYERTGHLTFSPNQARGLADVLNRKADEIELGKLVCRPSEVGTAQPKIEYKCPHCGWIYDREEALRRDRKRAEVDLVPTHDFPRPCRQVCPGTGQNPRSIHDRRPLWKDERGGE